MCRKLRYGLVISWVLFSPWFKFFILLFSFAVTCYCWFILSEVIFFFEVFFEVIFNTSVFSGCVFALGSQRVSLCEGTEL